MTRWVGVGDSLTKGVPGISYLAYLRSAPTVNYGRGGDTLASCLGRLPTLRFEADDRVILLIGINDFFLPHLRARSQLWRYVIDHNYRQGKLPSSSLDQFEDQYRMILASMTSIKQLCVVTLPIITEDPNTPLNQSLLEANERIQVLAHKFQRPVVDFGAHQRQALAHTRTYLSPSPFHLILDTLITKVPGLRQALVRLRQLHLTTDGVHLNDASAAALAQLIESQCSSTSSVETSS